MNFLRQAFNVTKMMTSEGENIDKADNPLTAHFLTPASYKMLT